MQSQECKVQNGSMRPQGMAERIPVDIGKVESHQLRAERLLEEPEWDALKGQSLTGGNGGNKEVRSRALNLTRFLCRSQIRDFLLHHARETRAHEFTRVSEETLIEINEQVRLFLIARVRRLPSKGKTI